VKAAVKISYVEIGICGLSCRLCPAHHRETKSKCPGCKSEYRMGAACAFQNCALKRKAVEFCGFCDESKTCERWRKNREMGKKGDSLVSYQKVEDNIAFIQKSGMPEFEKQEKAREDLLKAMMGEFNEGRSKTLYCVAATVLKIGELEKILNEARAKSKGLDLNAKSKIIHSLLDEIANEKNYLLKLRK
jgi:ATP-dependent protease HslVU (ClpYQ) ATPase subunit